MKAVLIDTSALIEFLHPRGRTQVQVRVDAALARRQLALCPWVRLEFLAGASKRQEALFWEATALMTPVEHPTKAWQLAEALALRTHRAGRPMVAPDLLIFATARALEMDLLHADAHFDWLEELEASS